MYNNNLLVIEVRNSQRDILKKRQRDARVFSIFTTNSRLPDYRAVCMRNIRKRKSWPSLGVARINGGSLRLFPGVQSPRRSRTAHVHVVNVENLNTTLEKPNERRRFAHTYVRTCVCIKSHAHACYIVSCAPLTSGRVRCVSRNQEKGKARNCLDRSLERRRVSNTTLPRYY